jgi:hypothetical protein
MREVTGEAWWNNHYPEAPPVGFLLRQVYSDRWLRIHSLPGSKRYASRGTVMRKSFNIEPGYHNAHQDGNE